MNFTDKTILITGAARGIGRAIAAQFAAANARVALHYRSDTQLAEQTLAELEGADHNRHALFQADLTDARAARSLVESVVDRFGQIDVLVNNAAIFADHPLTELSYEQWQRAWRDTINTNLIGPANLSYCVAHQMIKQADAGQGGGKMINISSRGAFRGEPNAPAYGASKAGLNAMSQSLAQALAPYGIFVYVIAPGFVDTERVAPKVQGDAGAGIRQQSPLNRVAQPGEIAKTVLFLASEGTDFLTGGIIDVNGASYLRS